MNRVTEIRRRLHMYPEVGFDLTKTLEIVRAELDSIGVEYTERYGKSSIVATVNPEKTSYTIGIRADMDALPICETNDVPYKSLNDGYMHACGHDAHTAIALDALREIYSMRDEISCRVKFIFQPAEEYKISGARLMADDGVMDDIDCIVALHCGPARQAGQIDIVDGPRNAISDGFELNFFGKSAHAAKKHEGIDAILMASRAYVALTSEIRSENAENPVIFNIGKIRGGDTNNIVCDSCSMFCTLRTWYDETAVEMLDRIKAICNDVANDAGGRFEFVTVKHYPKVNNDPGVAEAIRRAARQVVGDEHVGVENRGMGGEDFSYFAHIKPGAMFILGTGNEERGIVHGLHNDKFDIDESALKIGVDVFVRFVMENMRGYRQ